MRRILILDIETIPAIEPAVRTAIENKILEKAEPKRRKLDAQIKALVDEEVTADKRLVDPDKIKRSIAERYQKRDEKVHELRTKFEAALAEEREKIDEGAALSPVTGQIVAIGWAMKDRIGQWFDAVWTSGTSTHGEAGLLEAWAKLWCSTPDTLLVSWNGRAFDLPFLAARCMKHQIEFSGYCPLPLTDRRSHFDLMADVFGRDAYDLNATATALTGKGKEGCGWREIPALVAAGEWDTVAAYCAADVARTRELFERVQPYTTFLL